MSADALIRRRYGCFHICQLFKACQKYAALSFSSSFVDSWAQIPLGDNYSEGIVSMSSHMHAAISSIFVCFSEKSPWNDPQIPPLRGLSAGQTWPSHTSLCPLGGPTATASTLMHIYSPWDLCRSGRVLMNPFIHRNANLTCWNLVKHLNFMFGLKMGWHTNPAFMSQNKTDASHISSF